MRTAPALIRRTGDRPADPTARSSGRDHGSAQWLGAVSSQYRSGSSPALAHATVDSRSKQRDRFRFRNFREALTFVQEIGELAETEGHHPDISFGWGNATVSLQTKKI